MVPRKYALPFTIGVFHGDSKPDINEFLKDLIDELKELSPKTRATGHCVAEVRLVLGDCPMRAWLTGIVDKVTALTIRERMDPLYIFFESGTVSHGGRLACQDCKIVGTKEKRLPRSLEDGNNPEKRRGMKYIRKTHKDRQLRTDEEWPLYATREGPNEPLQKAGEGHVRRINESPFHQHLQFNMVSNPAYATFLYHKFSP